MIEGVFVGIVIIGAIAAVVFGIDTLIQGKCTRNLPSEMRKMSAEQMAAAYSLSTLESLDNATGYEGSPRTLRHAIRIRRTSDIVDEAREKEMKS